MRDITRPCRFTLIVIFAAAFCTSAQAADLKVNCNGTGALSTINSALKLLNPIGPNTVTVSGACHENVLIQSFDRLTLTANPGASINDASGGTVDVITIEDSQRVRYKVSPSMVAAKGLSASATAFVGSMETRSKVPLGMACQSVAPVPNLRAISFKTTVMGEVLTFESWGSAHVR